MQTYIEFWLQEILGAKALKNTILALLSQYACCRMGFLIVRIVENINEFLGPRSNGYGRRGCDGRTDGQTDRQTET